MDLITRTPGLLHIAEKIFSNLDRKSIWQCQKVNDYWWNILMNPWFWFNRMKPKNKLSKEHRLEWMEFFEKLSKLIFTKEMMPPLNYIYAQFEDSVPLYGTYWFAIKHKNEKQRRYLESLNISEFYLESSGWISASSEIVRIMAPLIENPNALSKDGYTPICWAVQTGNTEIVNILAPLLANPNASNDKWKDSNTYSSK